ncbi:MAG: hypothetical protein H7A46_09900 [Verrucomicrobiales bacterium]|nr:hypothetical protein [Verrucomicrobiales bacterium]
MKSDLHLATRLRHLATSLLPLLCATPLVGATVTWDGGGDGTSWNDPANWVADTLPGPDDDAVIAGGSGTVQVTASAQVAGLQVEAEQNLRVSGSGTVFEATGLAIIDDVTIEVQSGAVVRLGQLTEGTTQSSWTVDGPGSRLELPSLERLVTTGGGQYFGASGEGAELNLSALTEIVPQGWGLKFRATSGGKVDLSALPDVAGDIELATYFQAEMDLSSLTRFEGHVESQVGSSPPTLKVQDTSVLRIPQLTKVKGNLVLYGDATVETEQLADLTGSLVLYGGEWEFPQIASIDDLTLQVRGGAVLRLPQITECVITTQTWVVEDAGSRLELSNLQTMTLSTGGSTSYLGASGEGAGLLLPSLTAIHQASSMGGVNIRGYSGARLDLGALTSVEGGVNFMVRFASELDLSSLESFPNPPEAPLGELHVYDTSVLRAPLLRQFRGDLLLSGDATVETDQLTDVTGTLTLSGGEWEFPLLPNIDDLALTLRDGAVLRLPQFTEVHAANVQRPGVSPSWTVYGNSTLEFPNLQRLVLDRNMNWDVQTGGRLLLPALTEIAFQGYGLDVYCGGDGSLVETPGLTELDGNIRIRARLGGTVDVSGLTRLNAAASDGILNSLVVSLEGTLIAPDLRTIRAEVTVYGDATVATAQWEDVTGSLTLYGGEWEFPLLPNIDDLALTLRDGAVLRLPQFTEVHRGTEWGIDWNVYGGSTLDLPSLQRLVLDRNMNWDVQSGASLLLPALTEIALEGHSLDVHVEGQNARLELAVLPQLSGTARLRSLNGGLINLPQLLTFDLPPQNGYSGFIVHDGTIRLATESGQRCEGLADLVWEGSGMIEAPDLRLSSESLVRIPEKSTGTAVFRGSLTSSGSVRVPNTESLLRVEGNYQQTATGILELNLAPEQQNGKKLQMEVTQTCEFGGTLKLWAGDDYLTYAGGSLTVASHTGSVGEFDDVQHVLRNPDLLPPGKELYGVVLQYLDDALVVVPGWKLQPAAFPPEGGTVAEAGIFAPDALAPIIATPAMGWLFDHWEGAGITDVLSPNTTVLMDRNQNVTGVFVRPLDPSVVVTLDHNCPDISPTASTG